MLNYRVMRYTTDGHEIVVEHINDRREAVALLAQLEADREPEDFTEYGIEDYEVSGR